MLYCVISFASMNPYDKNTILTFSDDVAWKVDKSGVIKTGFYYQRGKRNFFKLIISNEILTLRLQSKNNKTYREIQLLDMSFGVKRLTTFDWCLKNIKDKKNQKKLKNSMTVKNNTCVINKNKNELIIKLYDQDYIQLNKYSQLQINIKLDNKKIFLRYSLGGFNESYDNYLNQYIKANDTSYEDVIEVEAISTNEVTTDASVIESLDIKQVKKAISLEPCYIEPPERYYKKIKTISYPCSDEVLKSAANKKMDDSVKSLKKSQLAEKQKRDKEYKRKQQKLKKQKNYVNKKNLNEKQEKDEWAVTRREIEMSAKDRERWIQRCKRHWERLVSPCYCQSYLSRAPDNVKDTCRK